MTLKDTPLSKEWIVNGEFRVAEWLVQPELGIITKADQNVGLEPKVMEVLVYLAQHADKVLPKELIIQTVWKDAFVTDEVLTNAISTLRKAFGDDSKNPEYIQTLPRRGHRLIAPVTYPVDDSGLESRNLPDSDLVPGRRKPAVWLAADTA